MKQKATFVDNEEVPELLRQHFWKSKSQCNLTNLLGMLTADEEIMRTSYFLPLFPHLQVLFRMRWQRSSALPSS